MGLSTRHCIVWQSHLDSGETDVYLVLVDIVVEAISCISRDTDYRIACIRHSLCFVEVRV